MDLVEGARLVAIAYLLTVAAAACFGAHRALLGFPLYLAYSIASFIAYLFSFGRLRLAPMAHLAATGSRRRLGKIWADWRETRAEERALARGEQLDRPREWISVASPDKVEVDQAPPPLADEPEATELPTLPDFRSGE